MKIPKFKLDKKRAVAIAFFAILPLLALFYFFPVPGALAEWWDSDWYFRQAITLTNNTSEETNVYISLTLDTSDSSKFQPDCGDIRFLQEDNNNLSYYIVSGCGATSTLIHVNYERFPAGAQTLYLYYGNESADNSNSQNDFATAASNYTLGLRAPEEQGPAPALYLPLDEGFGSTAHDETSYRNDGTIVGATWQNEDQCKSGKCLAFDGNGDYIEIADDPSLSLSTEMTLEAWVKPISTSPQNQTIISKEEKPVDPTKIYRSVGPSASTALSTGAANAMNITGDRATFATALPDNIGVGDVIQYDDDDDGDIDANDSLAFITERLSSQEYRVANASGAVPTPVNSDNNWSLFRAYTSLANAEKGVENTGVDSDLRNFDDWTAGGDATTDDVGKDLVVANQQWNIACYANGTTVNGLVDFFGWTTSASSFLNIFTPVSPSEVGVSQRHNGKWDANKFNLSYSGENHLLQSGIDYIIFDGLQFSLNSGAANKNTLFLEGVSGGNVTIKNNIFSSDKAGSINAIYVNNAGSYGVNIFNNIISGFSVSAIHIQRVSLYKEYIYNNIIYNSGVGIYTRGDIAVLKNNIVNNCEVDYSNWPGYDFDTSSSNNIMNDTPTSTNAFGATYTSSTTNATTASKLINSAETFISKGVQVGSIIKNTTDNTHTYVTALDSETQLSIANDIFVSGENYSIYKNKYGNVSFVSTTAGSEDFHLSPTDTVAKNSGADLSGDSVFPFNSDIDGGIRCLKSEASDACEWDIGADEAQATQIYRSVAPNKTDALEDGEDNSMTIVGNIATFQCALADNVGVGDVIQYDDDGDGDIDANDSLAFIVERITNYEYRITNASGGVPTPVNSDTNWSLFRAYTSLANAENGDENTGIDSDLRNFDTWSGGKDLVTSKEQWNIACYTNGVVVDDLQVAVTGWTTGAQNIIKIYTPVREDEVGVSQRHIGIMNTGYKQSTVSGHSFIVYEDFVFVDGLEIEATDVSYPFLISSLITDNSKIILSNSLVRGGSISPGATTGVNNKFYIINSIIGDVDHDPNSKVLLYVLNSTINGRAVLRENTVSYFKNVISNTDDAFLIYSGAQLDCTYCALKENKGTDWTSGANNKINQTFNFVNEAGGDYHLAPTDTAARNAGLNLTNDPNLPILTDIDGEARERTASSSWDIGADEAAATKIYRSVGPGNTSALATDEAHDNEVEVTAGVATFEVDLPDRIGVGDAVIIDTGGTANAIDASDTLLFIHGRIDSKNYLVRTHTGALPSDIASNDTYSLYRAYTSLANAENGTKNTSIPMAFNGGNRDLVTNNEEWNIACYGDGVDVGWIYIDGWITGFENFVKIYTPVNSNEVGINQRNNGQKEKGFKIEGRIQVSDRFVKLDGISAESSNIETFFVYNVEGGAGEIQISNCFSLITSVDSFNYYLAVVDENIKFKLYNNIAVNNGSGHGFVFGQQNVDYYLYNNTAVVNSGDAFHYWGGNQHLSNNLAYVYGSGRGFGNGGGTPYVPYFSNNASSDATADDWGGIGNKINQTFQFRDAANDDFRLAMTDTAAKGAGINLSYDANLPVAHDIEGELRPGFCGTDGGDEACLVFTGGVFDIGADQISGTIHRNYSLTLDNDYPRAYQSTGNDDNESFSSGDINLPANEWSHIVYKRDNDREELYINGARKDSATISDFLKTNKGKLYIGAQDANSKNSFKGFLDEVRLYPYARTADEIKKDTTQGSSGRAAARASEGVGVAIGDSGNSLSDGLVGYWKMDEASWNGTANEVIDHSGNNNHGVASGGASTTAGKFGNGGGFDGTDDWVTVNDNDSISTINAYTYSAWVRFNSVASILDSLISKKSEVSATRTFLIARTSAGGSGGEGGIRLAVTHNGIENYTGWNYPYQEWFHLAVRWDGSNIYIYNNGVLTNQFPASGPLETTDYPLIIGNGTNNFSWDGMFDGSQDDIRFYNRALSPDEIKQLYNYAPGPVLHLKMDEKTGTTAFDSSGNGNNGTLTNGPIWENGKINGGLSFDGVDDNVDITDDDSFDLAGKNFTLSAWYKQDTLAGGLHRIVVSPINEISGSENFSIYVDGSNACFIKRGSPLDDIICVTPTDIGVWHYLSGVYDGQEMRIYIDGILKDKKSSSVAIIVSNNNLQIGRYGPTWGQYFNGSIDDVRIYNYARTQEQILEDMNAQSGSIIGREGAALKQPILDLSFDEGFGPRAFDASGNNNHGTLYSGTTGANATSSAMWDKGGKIGGAMEFDGVNDVVSVSNVQNWLDLVSGSISFWYKANSAADGDYLVAYQNGTGEALSIMTTTGTTLRCAVTGNWISGVIDIPIPNVSTDTIWHHLVFTWDKDAAGKTITGTIDGTRTVEADTLGQPNSISGNFYFGARSDGSLGFPGYIDNVKIYNYALSEDEIKTLYNDSSAMVMGNDESRDNNGTEVTGANKDYCIPGDTAKCDKPVLELKMDEMTGATAYDTSGNGNNGTLTNGPVWDRGKINGGVNFDGIDDYISSPDIPFGGTNPITVCSWAKPGNLPGVIVSQGTEIVLRTNGSNLEWILNSFTSNDRVIVPNAMQVNNWHHVCGTYASGGSMILYLDGREIGRITPSGEYSDITNDFYWGRLNSGGSEGFWNGSIDEVRIYDYARTPAQIAWDYNRGKPINEWRFDEGAGTVVHDQGPNRNNGTITGAVWKSESECKYSKCLSFNGANDYVGITTPVSSIQAISFWLKPDNLTQSILDLDGGTHKLSISSGAVTATGFNAYYVDGLANGTISSANWHHILATTNAAFNSSAAFSIGKINTAYYAGKIDNLKIYNYIPTAEQIKLDYNGGAVGFR